MKVGDIVVIPGWRSERRGGFKARVERVTPDLVVDAAQAEAAGLGPYWSVMNPQIATLAEELELAAYIQDHNGKVPAGY